MGAARSLLAAEEHVWTRLISAGPRHRPDNLVVTSALTKSAERISRLTDRLGSARLEGVVICPGPNMTYYTGVKAQLLERPFVLLVQSDGPSHLLVPKLEAGPFRESGLDLVLHEWDDNQGPRAAFEGLFSKIRYTATEWGCEGRVPFGFLDHLQSRGMRLRPADDALQSIRSVKEPFELETIRRSAKILAGSYMKIPGFLREGMTERELSRSIVEDALAGGAESVETCMVQSGPRSADPHSDTSSRQIRRGESVVVDAVSFYEGYAADITRTFSIGGGDATLEETYESVLAAQEKGVLAAAAGVSVGEVDAAARDSLTRDGLGDRFIHRTGHGLGLEVHEAPYIVSGGRETLEAGMVFTVEPGAYLPQRLGVRIEDDLIATSGGVGGREVVTADVPKEFGWWR
jgi:Xaa-Pro aminopeptidase